jgi:hypothetical protein
MRMNNKHLIVVGDRVLVRPEDGEDRTKVGPVQRQQVEGEVRQVGPLAAPVLQCFKAGNSRGGEHHDLAVQKNTLRTQLLCRGDQLREIGGPLRSPPRYQLHRRPLLHHGDAVAVELELVDPA